MNIKSPKSYNPGVGSSKRKSHPSGRLMVWERWSAKGEEKGGDPKGLDYIQGSTKGQAQAEAGVVEWKWGTPSQTSANGPPLPVPRSQAQWKCFISFLKKENPLKIKQEEKDALEFPIGGAGTTFVSVGTVLGSLQMVQPHLTPLL
jgi:hypothetical protein